MNEYWPFIVVFVFAVVLYFGTILWTEVFFPDKEPSTEEQERIRRIQVERFIVAALQPGLFDKAEEEEKGKATLSPAYRR